MSAAPFTTADEFVEMTMAFADDLADKTAMVDLSKIIEAREALRRHLHDSYRGIAFYFYAKGMERQRELLKGEDQ